MWGPQILRLLFRAFVVVVGFLILSGAVNTAIIGSNGVLNRVSEDGVLTDWFRQPHPRFGTTYRIINLVVILQIFTILASRGNVYLLGEAYAFGVIWSFTFNSLAMLVLRFKYKGERGWKVPPNITIAGHEIPVGLVAVFLVLFCDRNRESVHQVDCDGGRRFFCRRIFPDLHRLRTSQPEETRPGASSR